MDLAAGPSADRATRSAPSGRDATIDVARGLAILLVVLGHNRIGRAAIDFLYSFHVPAFFLLAGLTFQYRRYRDAPGALMRSRFRRIALPYLVSAPFFYLVWLAVGRRFGQDSAGAIPVWKPLVGILYASSPGGWMAFNVPLWFLPTLFVASIVLWWVLHLAKSRSAAIQAAIVLGTGALGYLIGRSAILPWGGDLAFVAAVFMFAGHRLGERARAAGRPVLVPAPAALIALAVLVAVYLANGSVDMNERRYQNFLLFLIGGLAGSAAVLFAAALLRRWRPAARLFTLLGRESLIILVFHLLGMQALAALTVAATDLEVESTRIRYWWAYTAFAILFSVAVGAAIRRIPVLRGVYYGDAPSDGTPPAKTSSRPSGLDDGVPESYAPAEEKRGKREW